MDEHPSGDKPILLADLATLSGLPVRTVRYYIQRGLVDRPVGAGRGAHYTARHLEQLLAIRRWTEAGLALDRIQALAEAPPETLPPPRPQGSVSVRSHVALLPGVDLVIDPELAGLAPEQVRELARRTLAICREIEGRNGEKNEE
jgi:DNA-binding transcriptional MerR regulator